VLELWTRVTWIRIASRTEFCEQGNEHSGFHKGKDSSWSGEQLHASENGLCPMELVPRQLLLEPKRDLYRHDVQWSCFHTATRLISVSLRQARDVCGEELLTCRREPLI
jgi:hypothetical protein